MGNSSTTSKTTEEISTKTVSDHHTSNLSKEEKLEVEQPSNIKKTAKREFVVTSQYEEVIILQQPRCTLADLIRFIKSYGDKESPDISGIFGYTEWPKYRTSHLLALYMRIYLKNRVKKRYKFDQYLDRYYDNIPTIADVQQIYRPYLDHIVSQISKAQSGTSVLRKFHIYMNKPILMGPIKKLSMHKKDLLVFGWIHLFQNENKFYSQIIPWDVIKLIHLFYDPINKEYFEKFEHIKKQIIAIESDINILKKDLIEINNDGNTDKYGNIENCIQQKQFELFSLYDKTRDTASQERYLPHLVDEYLFDTQQYKLSAKAFANRIRLISYTKFETIYNKYDGNRGVGYHPIFFGNQMIDYKSFLMQLLNEITRKKHVGGNRIKQQFIIYEDYIKQRTRWRRFTPRELYDELPGLILEILNEDNHWTQEIERAIQRLTKKDNKVTSKDIKYGDLTVKRGKFGSSYTID